MVELSIICIVRELLVFGLKIFGDKVFGSCRLIRVLVKNRLMTQRKDLPLPESGVCGRL